MQEDKEEWRDIPGYEGYYQVSNLGRFASFINMGNHLPDGIRRIKPLHRKKNGYYVAILCKSRKYRHIYIHRLVADVFCEKSENRKEIDHIDGDKSNNKASNLRFVTPKENQANPHTVKKRYENARKSGIKIRQFSLEGEYVRSFYSLRQIEREYPNVSRQRVLKCAQGEIKSVCGYVWKF